MILFPSSIDLTFFSSSARVQLDSFCPFTSYQHILHLSSLHFIFILKQKTEKENKKTKGSIESSATDRLGVILKVAEQIRGGNDSTGGQTDKPDFLWLIRDRQVILSFLRFFCC